MIGFNLVVSAIFGQGYSIQELKLNTSFSEHSPTIYGDGIVFCSDRRSKLFTTVSDSSGNYLSKLYMVDQLNEKDETKTEMFSDRLQGLLNEGAATFNSDGSVIYFTSNIDSDSKTENGSLGIFYSENIFGEWQEAVPFLFNSPNGKYNLAHPCLSADEMEIYFSSDMPGSYGKADIYVCYKNNNGNWGAPQNLGSKINTSNNEVFPFIGHDRKLYFSSNGRDTTGSMDVFFSQIRSDRSVDVPTKLAEPINSEYDDFAYVLDASGEFGYFSSNRKKGNDDIYRFKVNYPEFNHCSPFEKPVFCYWIEEEKIVENDSLPLIYEWDFGDGTKSRGLSSIHCFPDYGDYEIALNIYDTITSLQYAKVSELFLSIEKPNTPFIESRDTVYVDEEFTMDASLTEIESYEVENYYWKTGDGRTLKGINESHYFKEPGEYQLELGVTKTLETVGPEKLCVFKKIIVLEKDMKTETDEPNDIVASMVDESTPNELGVEETIEDSSLYYVHFKESNSQIPLNDPFFEKIKYEITERFIERDSMYKYSVGEAWEIAKLYKIYQELLVSGYSEAMVYEELSEDFSDEVVKRGNYISESVRVAMNEQINKFSDIRFDFNSDVLKESSYTNLNHIVEVMEIEKGIRLQINAYTDNIGTDKENQKLSEQRALSVFSYLNSKGINPNRIEYTGFGDTSPLMPNATEEGRSMNRRVEFEILLD